MKVNTKVKKIKNQAKDITEKKVLNHRTFSLGVNRPLKDHRGLLRGRYRDCTDIVRQPGIFQCFFIDHRHVKAIILIVFYALKGFNRTFYQSIDF